MTWNWSTLRPERYQAANITLLKELLNRAAGKVLSAEVAQLNFVSSHFVDMAISIQGAFPVQHRA